MYSKQNVSVNENMASLVYSTKWDGSGLTYFKVYSFIICLFISTSVVLFTYKDRISS